MDKKKHKNDRMFQLPNWYTSKCQPNMVSAVIRQIRLAQVENSQAV